MARRSRATGVGRGHGPGSALSQFKDGMPSANPNGRPRREKEPAPQSIQEAVAAILRREVVLEERGKGSRRVPQMEALLEYMIGGFPRMKPQAQIQLLRFCMEIAPDVLNRAPTGSSNEKIAAFVERLRQEHKAGNVG